MKKIDASIILGLIFTLIIGNFNGFAKECENVTTQVLRLHVLANSDADYDQELKLKVRDAILNSTSEKLNCDSLDKAQEVAISSLGDIEKIAEQTIKENGYNYTVKAEIVNMFFDTRYYENVTMPAGKYKALRVTIGSGQGKNWWCVLYPPLCVSPAIATDYDEIQVCTKNGFKAKFKIVEWFETAKNYLENLFSENT